MKSWVRKIRGAIGMGVTWALGWAPVAVVISLIMEARAGLPIGSLIDNWLIGLVPLGFLGGSIFSGILSALEGRRRFDQLSLPRFALAGAAGGLLLGAIAVGVGLVGASFGGGFGLREMIIMATATLLGSGSASGSLALARVADDQELLDAANDVAKIGLTEGETNSLLSG